MIVTEAEAQRLRCPAGCGDELAVVVGDTVRHLNFCVGAQCMWWIWEERRPMRSVGHEITSERTGRGYCGMARR